MSDDRFTYTFTVIEDLYDNYSLLVNELSGVVSVYCEECETWVAEYERDTLYETSDTELYEMIVRAHDKQVNGVEVSFDTSETFL